MDSDKCKLCKYVIASNKPGQPWYVCVNQDSPNFGKGVGPGCNEYDKFSARSVNEFKDALETLVMYPHGAYPSHYFLYGNEDDLGRPCIVISFENNKQMMEYRDANLRCFEELMKLKKEAGDFQEGGSDESN